jgi:hypothetical protein
LKSKAGKKLLSIQFAIDSDDLPLVDSMANLDALPLRINDPGYLRPARKKIP